MEAFAGEPDFFLSKAFPQRQVMGPTTNVFQVVSPEALPQRQVMGPEALPLVRAVTTYTYI